MLELHRTSLFRKDLKTAIKRGLPINELDTVIRTLQEEKPLDPKYRDHALTGNYAKHRECHILPDWLFIYRVDNGKLLLVATRTGSHSDLY